MPPQMTVIYVVCYTRTGIGAARYRLADTEETRVAKSGLQGWLWWRKRISWHRRIRRTRELQKNVENQKAIEPPLRGTCRKDRVDILQHKVIIGGCASSVNSEAGRR